MTGFVGRPSTERYDTALVFAETTTPGMYVAKTDGIASGNWIVQLQASRLRAEQSEIVYRLWGREKARIPISNVESAHIRRARWVELLVIRSTERKMTIALYPSLKKAIENAERGVVSGGSSFG